MAWSVVVTLVLFLGANCSKAFEVAVVKGDTPGKIVKYWEIEKLGKGGNAVVYKVKDVNGNFYALKHEGIDGIGLPHEYEALTKMQDSNGNNNLDEKSTVGFPLIFLLGTTGSAEANTLQNVLVMELLGASFHDEVVSIKKTDLTDTQLQIMYIDYFDQMLECLSYIHEHRVVHNDVKGDNFVFGLGIHTKKLYLIDFGSAYILHKTNTDYSRTPGVFAFLSPNHELNIYDSGFIKYSDDVFSLVYSFVHEVFNKIPWIIESNEAQSLCQQNNWELSPEILNKLKQTTEAKKNFPNTILTYLPQSYSKLAQLLRWILIKAEQAPRTRYLLTGFRHERKQMETKTTG